MSDLIRYSELPETLAISADDPDVVGFVFPGENVATLPPEERLRRVGSSFIRAAILYAVQTTPHFDALSYAADEWNEMFETPSPSRMAVLVESSTALGRVEDAPLAARHRNALTMLRYGSVLLRTADWGDRLGESQVRTSISESLQLPSEWEPMWGWGNLGSAHIESSAVGEPVVAVHFTADSSVMDPLMGQVIYDSPAIQASGKITFEQTAMSAASSGVDDGIKLRVSGNVQRTASDRHEDSPWDTRDPMQAALQLAALTAEILSSSMDKRVVG